MPLDRNGRLKKRLAAAPSRLACSAGIHQLPLRPGQLLARDNALHTSYTTRLRCRTGSHALTGLEYQLEAGFSRYCRSSRLKEGQTPGSNVPLLLRGVWRRTRDSNPRYVAVYTLSRRAPSTTRPALRRARILAQPLHPL